MAPLRVRHSQGVATIDIDLENATVLELQQELRRVTNILPSRQEVKTGFPAPKTITLVSELPVSSLGLKRGDQLIVNEIKETPTTTAQMPLPAASNPPPLTGNVPHGRSTGASRGTTGEPPAPRPAPKSIPTASRQISSSISPSGTPAASRAPAAASSSSSAPEEITTPSGVLVHRVVPDDNSCLFSSIGIVFEQDMAVAPKLRQVVADAIRANPIDYDDVTLGRPKEEYIKAILSPSTWGGAIELSIFSKHYKTEISSFDIETGRCDRFGEGEYSSRVILLYSGIHYDAVSLSPISNAPFDFHTTIFPVSDQSIMDGTTKLATQLRAKKAYTNTATFDLRCEICNTGIKGEKEAREHAKQTGHAKFGEY